MCAAGGGGWRRDEGNRPRWRRRRRTPRAHPVPVAVTYELTDLGSSLFEVVSRMKAWAEAQISEVREARQKYDESA
ncbi:winged helix-turn-helix transcriptional regulator [Microbacterium sp. DT81.1]|uniref:winged helix-turn-helix transcriptional regulator n=1 Tax=Microbacterium sp. DT81.1 TaxID=3393413 RepID=UPI003CFA8A15